MGGVDGSQETRTTSRKYGQKYSFAQMDTALQKLSSLLPDCLDLQLVFAVLIITESPNMGFRQEYQQHGILFEFLEIVQNGLMLATR